MSDHCGPRTCATESDIKERACFYQRVNLGEERKRNNSSILIARAQSRPYIQSANSFNRPPLSGRINLNQPSSQAVPSSAAADKRAKKKRKALFRPMAK